MLSCAPALKTYIRFRGPGPGAKRGRPRETAVARICVDNMEQRFTDVAALRAYHVPCESRFDADLYKLPSGRNMKMGTQVEVQAKPKHHSSSA